MKNNIITYKTAYFPEINKELRNRILNEISHSMVSNDGKSFSYDIYAILANDYKIDFPEDIHTLEKLKKIGVTYIEISK